MGDAAAPDVDSERDGLSRFASEAETIVSNRLTFLKDYMKVKSRAVSNHQKRMYCAHEFCRYSVEMVQPSQSWLNGSWLMG